MNVFDKNQVAFTSDTHFGHANIIKYCQRPFTFPDIDGMDKVMLEHFMDVDASGKTIFHMGDFVFNPKNLLATSWRPKGEHYIILGNHDKFADKGGKYRKLYREFFHHIIGTSIQWGRNQLQIQVEDTKLLLTHGPERYIGENHYNIYGHHHNNMFLKPEYFQADPLQSWVFGSKTHINVSVELTNYRPVTWDELFNIPRV
jgi:calcineurin-like phosphoesterase family protein